MGTAHFFGGGKAQAVPSRTSAAELSRAALYLRLQLAHAGNTRTGYRLIGTDDHSPQPGGIVQRLEHGHGCHGRAVRVRHDSLGDRFERVRVDLGDYEWNFRIHAPRR